MDFNIPNVVLPEPFYVEKTYNEAPKVSDTVKWKWKGTEPETYRYAAVIDGLVYQVVGPVERSNTSDAAYWLSATSQGGEPITLRVTISQFMKKGDDNLLEKRPQNKIFGQLNNHSYESVEIALSHSEPKVYVVYEVMPLIADYSSKSPLIIQVGSYKSYPNAYCYSQFR